MSSYVAPQHGHSNCARILCIGDDIVHLLDIQYELAADHDFVIVATVEEGETALASESPFDLIISGPVKRQGCMQELDSRIRTHSPDAERVVLARPGDRSATRMAANDARVMRVLFRPCPATLLREAVADALLRHRAREVRAEFWLRIAPRSTPVGDRLAISNEAVEQQAS